jgi:phosphoribosylaminoimidazole-succinocarboxamide synthase
MLVHKAERIDIECVVRGYIAGSLWKDYKRQVEGKAEARLLGFSFPSDLQESQKFDEPIFTPATKEENGHDMNISFEQMAAMVGVDIAARLRTLSKNIYSKASEYCAERGIILADTKFEFGFHNDQIILIDEVLSPDSSRFWPADEYEVGKSQESFDKQFVRDYLSQTGWDKNSEPPHLPQDVIDKTREKYEQVEKLLLDK